jgi:tetratricopeptide (TPR) repeat protein
MTRPLLRLAPGLLGLFTLSRLACAQGQSADELMAQGNLHYDRLQTKEALKYYLPAEKLEPKNAKLLAKISREYRHLMSDASSKSEKLRLGGLAVSYAERAVAAAPNDAEAQLAVAISYGKVLVLQGSREKVESSRKVKIAAEKAVKLDPSNDLGWHVLGRWHLVWAEVSGLQRTMAELVYGKMPPSSFEEAARNFRKAIALNPNRLMHYVELGRTYADMGQKEEARKNLKKGLQMRETEKDDPETKEKGRELLKKLG